MAVVNLHKVPKGVVKRSREQDSVEDGLKSSSSAFHLEEGIVPIW